jgi:hypothetical protein
MSSIRKLLPIVFLLAVAFAELGCASAGGSTDGSIRRRTDVLTRDEIATVQVGSLLEAIQRLRPRWLNVRGGAGLTEYSLAVYQGETRLGDLSVLRTLPPDFAESLRFLTRSAAQAQFTGNWSADVVGAIVIQTGVRAH